jgi:hypothetical protein
VTVCSSCSANYYLLGFSCTASCPARYFANTSERTCKLCFYDCLTCSSGDTCLSCSPADNRYLSSTGRCVPKDGYYDNSPSPIALVCPTGCRFCSSPTLCSSCLSGYYLVPGGTCSATCPARYLLNSQARVCSVCPFDCYTCDANRLCLSCNATSDFRVLDSVTRKCIPAPGYFESTATVAS